MKKNHSWTTNQDYINYMLSNSSFSPKTEWIPVREAVGRVTAQNLYSKNTLPNIPSSAMDGIAIKGSQLNGSIPDTSQWKLGVEYVFSNTGVGIEPGFDTVVVIEDVEIDENGGIKIGTIPKQGQNVRPVGNMVNDKELLVPSNCVLGPAQLGLLTAGGYETIPVIEKPKIAILPTGNELVPVGVPVPPGKNVDFNGIMIEAMVRMMGAEPILYPITRDGIDDLTKVIKEALEASDIVILNGGTSKGSDDRSIEVLESMGTVLVYEMAYGPGKHTTLTVVGSKLVIGSVGPTIGAENAIEWYIPLLINKYYNCTVYEMRMVQARLLEDIAAPAPFDFYARVNVKKAGNEYTATGAGGRISPLPIQMMASGRLRIPGEISGYKAGEIVEVELRQPHLV